MNREEALPIIRGSWRDLFDHDSKKGIICPLCGSGSGAKGTGITEDPRSPGHLKCWACGFSGDVIDLLQHHHKIGFNDALKSAADELGITIDTWQPTQEQRRQQAAKDFAEAPPWIAEDAQSHESATNGKSITEGVKREIGANTALTDYTEYYSKCAWRVGDPEALSFLQARGISIDTATRCFVGYDPAWQSPTKLKEARIKGEREPYPSKRLIFPGSPNSYTVSKAITNPDKSYYMKENGGGNGYIFNGKALWESETVFIVEGQFDCLSVVEVGGACVGLNSANNVGLLLQILETKPTSATLVLALDNDDAGRKAQKELAEGLNRLNISFIGANISGTHKDPNEALTADREGFTAAVAKAIKQTSAKPDNVADYLAAGLADDIAKMQNTGERFFGFEELDKKSGGIHPGLYLLGAISSLGKTTFMLQIADNLAAAGHDVLFFSLEMSRFELITKSLAREIEQSRHETGEGEEDDAITSLALRKGYYSNARKAAVATYSEKVGDRLSIIELNFGADIFFIGDYVRRYKAKTNKTPVVFIDYLQIISASEAMKRKTVKEQVDEVVVELKRLSRDEGAPVIVASSVNRANYATTIDFESFKESGGLEFSADVVFGMQLSCMNESLFADPGKKIGEKRERIRQEKAGNPRRLEVICLKNRYGVPSYKQKFHYYPASDLFVEVSSEGLTPYHAETPFDEHMRELADKINAGNVSASF